MTKQRLLTSKLASINQSLSSQLDQNKLLTKELVNSEEAIRHEIAQELHDDIGQNITAIRTQAMIMQKLKPSDTLKQHIGLIQGTALNVYDTIHSLLHRLRPKALDDLGLKPAIEQLLVAMCIEKLGIQHQLTYNIRNHSLSKVHEITIYRMIQESLNNCLKYANAKNVEISLTESTSHYQLSIHDDGSGFDPQKVNYGQGIRGLRERAEALGGTFNITSISGTHIDINLPFTRSSSK